MIKFFLKIVFMLVLVIFIYLWPKMFLEVPTSINITKLYNGNNNVTITLPRGEGYEPWIAIRNCKKFNMQVMIYNSNNQLIYQVYLNEKSKQIQRLGDLMHGFKSKQNCKYIIVQNDAKKWKLFHYLKKYKIEIISKNIPDGTMLNLDYLKLWFPSH